MRSVSQEVIDAIAGNYAYCHLIEILLDTPIYLTDANVDIEHSGVDYVSTGHILGIDDVESTTEVVIPDISLEFSNVDQAILSALNDSYLNTEIKIHIAILDDYSRVIGVDSEVYAGLIDSLTDSEDGENATLTVNTTSSLARYESTAGIQANSASHQRYYPGDTGFLHADNATSAVAQWGHSGLNQSSGWGPFKTTIKMEPDQVTISEDSTDQFIPVVYGKAKVDGIRAYGITSGEDYRLYHIIDALSHGPVHSVEAWIQNLPSYRYEAGNYYDGMTTSEASKRPNRDAIYDSRYATAWEFLGTRKCPLQHNDVKLGTAAQTAPSALANYPNVAARYGRTTDENIDSGKFVYWKSENDSPILDNFLDTDKFAGVAIAHNCFRNALDTDWGGEPERLYIVTGRTLYDPRTGVTEWSDNPVLCWLDYMTNTVYGWGITYNSTNFNIDQIKIEADFCDQIVTGSDGEDRKLMTFNASIDTGRNRIENMKDMLKSFRARLTKSGTQWGVWIEKDAAPVMALTLDDFSSIDIEQGGVSDKYNRVLAEYTDYDITEDDEAESMQTTTATYPSDDDEYQVYLDEDRGVSNEKTISVKGLNNYDEASQAAQVEFLLSRIPVTATLDAMPRCHVLEGGDVITLTDETRGMNEVEWLVTSRSTNYDQGVTLELRLYDPTIYPWTDKDAPPAKPVYSLPAISEVAPPTGLSLTETPENASYSGRVSWTAGSDYSNGYESELLDENGDVLDSFSSTVTAQWFGRVVSGTYTFRVRAVTGFATSEWSSLNFTMAVPSAPVSVTVELGNEYVILRPQYGESVTPYGLTYEYYFRGEEESGARQLRGSGAVAFQISGLINATTYYFSVRAITAQGASDYVDVVATTTDDYSIILDKISEGIEIPAPEIDPVLDPIRRDLTVNWIERGIANWDLFWSAEKTFTETIARVEGEKESTARIAQAELTIAEVDEAVNTRVDIMEASVGENSARIETNEQTYASDQIAVSQKFETLESEVGENSSSITTNAQSISTLDGSVAVINQKLTAEGIDGEGDTILAQAEDYTRTAVGYCSIDGHYDQAACEAAGGTWNDGPLAENIRRMAIETGDGGEASISQLMQVQQTVDGDLIARGAMISDVNGRIGGYLTSNDGTQTNFDVLSDVFRVGSMDGANYVPAIYWDASAEELVVKARLILGDGTTLSDASDLDLSEGVPGPAGETGETGAAGAGFYALMLRDGEFPSDTLATSDFTTYLGRGPSQDDHLTYVSDDELKAQTKRYNGSSWVSPIAQFNGDLLVRGTVSGDRFAAGTEIVSPVITAGEINGGALNATTGTFAGELTAATGTFSGELEAATGTFSGVLTGAALRAGSAVIYNDDLRLRPFNIYEWVSDRTFTVEDKTLTMPTIGGPTYGAEKTFASPAAAFYKTDFFFEIFNSTPAAQQKEFTLKLEVKYTAAGESWDATWLTIYDKSFDATNNFSTVPFFMRYTSKGSSWTEAAFRVSVTSTNDNGRSFCLVAKVTANNTMESSNSEHTWDDGEGGASSTSGAPVVIIPDSDTDFEP